MIRYELADTFTRAVATIIDWLILLAISLIWVFIFGNGTLPFLVIFLLVAFYQLVMEMFNGGQSVGKRLLKIKVVTIDGRAPEVIDLIMRWIFRTIEVTGTLGSLAILAISSSVYKQRIGDILAQTAVIKLLPETASNLRKINQMETIDIPEVYFGLVDFTDEEMLFVKELLMRSQKYKITINDKIINAMAEKIRVHLNMDHPPEHPWYFLENVLKYYIHLTR